MTGLSADNESFLHSLVQDGTYPNVSQALNEAVELLRRRDSLRRDLQVGQAAADRGELLDGETVFEELLARAREIEAGVRRES